MRSGWVYRPVSVGSSWTLRRPGNEGLRGRLREIPWLEVGVNSCQLGRSCCGVLAHVVGSVTRFGNLPRTVRLIRLTHTTVSLAPASSSDSGSVQVLSVRNMYKVYNDTTELLLMLTASRKRNASRSLEGHVGDPSRPSTDDI